MSEKVKLSVIVCSWGRNKVLARCLKSLEEQTYKEFEVVVVSNTRYKIQDSRMKIRWVEDPKKGLAYARDLGWRRARGELVAWVDDDVVLDKDWAKEVVKVLDKNPDVGGVSGPTVIPEKLLSRRLVFWWYEPKGMLKKWMSKIWVRVTLGGNPYEVGKLTKVGWWTPGSNFKSSLNLKGLREVDYLEACNMTLRRKLVMKVGGYDLGFRGTSEWCEVDLARRVKKLGYRLVFSSKVQVKHLVSQSGVYAMRRKIPERIINYSRYLVRQVL